MKTRQIFLSVVAGVAMLLIGANNVWAGSASLTWNANTEPDLAGYRVYYDTTSRAGATPCTNAGYASNVSVGNVTTYNFSNLTDGVTYYFAVSAYDTSNNESTCSSQQSKVIPPAVDTTPPTVSVTAPSGGATVSGSSVTVSASASDNVGVSGVQFKLDTNANIGAEDTSSPYSITWDTTAVANGSHSLVAVVRDAAGNYATSSSVAITVDNVAPDTQAPSVPSSLSATAVSSSQINLSWTASTDDVEVDHYHVYRCQGGGCSPVTEIAAPSANSYSNTGLTASTLYRYSVAACDASGNCSAVSAVGEATTQAVTPATCTSFTYSAWSACQSNNTQTRSIASSSPSGCAGGSPVVSQSCTYIASGGGGGGFIPSTCTSFAYSSWSACQNNIQTRTVTSSSPSGCTGGSQ